MSRFCRGSDLPMCQAGRDRGVIGARQQCGAWHGCRRVNRCVERMACDIKERAPQREPIARRGETVVQCRPCGERKDVVLVLTPGTGPLPKRRAVCRARCGRLPRGVHQVQLEEDLAWAEGEDPLHGVVLTALATVGQHASASERAAHTR